MRRHPVAGARMLETLGAPPTILPVVLHHHERWDGSGYPTGRQGDEIPLEARVLCIADSFDAMTSTRPYRAPRRPDEAMAELERCAGTQFDPELVDAFAGAWAKALGVLSGSTPKRAEPFGLQRVTSRVTLELSIAAVASCTRVAALAQVLRAGRFKLFEFGRRKDRRTPRHPKRQNVCDVSGRKRILVSRGALRGLYVADIDGSHRRCDVGTLRTPSSPAEVASRDRVRDCTASESGS